MARIHVHELGGGDRLITVGHEGHGIGGFPWAVRWTKPNGTAQNTRFRTRDEADEFARHLRAEMAAGRARTRAHGSGKLTSKVESRRRWAEIHAAEQAGRPILNPRSYALGLAPARRRK